MKLIQLFILSTLSYTLLNAKLDDESKAARPNAPAVTSPISVVVPSLDLGAIQQTLASIKCKIGNVDQNVCEDTILSVLGDACTILGISISEALALLLECCGSTTVDFSTVFTVLQDIQDTLTDCCSTITADFQNTWTILADLKDTLTNCGMPTPITQELIPYTITQPGLYCLAEDVTLSGTGIIIESDNVILDLNEHQMIGGVIGISVLSEENVIIKNGIVRDQTESNISIDTVTMITNLLIEECQLLNATINDLQVFSAFRDIMVQNCILISTLATGMKINPIDIEDGSLGLFVESCLVDAGDVGIELSPVVTTLLVNIKNCAIQAVDNGINILAASEVSIVGCTIERCSNGIFIMGGSQIEIDNCTIRGSTNTGIITTVPVTTISNSIISANLGGGINLGTLIDSSVNSSVSNCSLISNTGFGISINNAGFNTIKDCDIKGTTAGDGIAISASNTVVSNCTLVTNGISVSNGAQPVTIENCQIQSAPTQGILVNDGSRITIAHCSLSLSGSHGILVSNGSNIIITNCSLNQSGSAGIQFAAGVDIVAVRDCVISNSLLQGITMSGDFCTIENCAIAVSGAEGIVLQAGSTVGAIINCRVATSSATGINTNTTNVQILNCSSTNNLGNGFVTSGTFAEVINNVSSRNSLNGFLNSGGATNKFYKNFATANTVANYSGVPATYTPATVLVGTFSDIIGNTDD